MTICFCYQGGDREAAEVALRITKWNGNSQADKERGKYFYIFSLIFEK
jgi:hypothetical protein